MPFELTATLLIIGALALLGVLIGIPLRELYKLRRRLRAEFGKPPAKRRGLHAAGKWYTSLAEAEPAHGAIDALTWNDLDLDEVFHRMNACQSALGDAALYTALRRPVTDQETLEQMLAAREALMAIFAADDALRLKAQYQLARLGRADADSLPVSAFHAVSLKLRGRPLFVLLALAPLLLLFLAFINPYLGIISAGSVLVANINIHGILKSRKDSGFRAVRGLASALGCARRLADRLAKASPETAAALRAAVRNYRTAQLSILILMANEISESTLGFDFTAFFQLPMLAYGQIAARMQRDGAATRQLYAQLGEIDLAIAVLSTRHSLDFWCRPTFSDAPALQADKLCHPLLEVPVPNSGHFERDVLLTGSNASGKSTFIKSVALACLMAQSLGTCTAQKLVLKPGRVATSMAVEDSVVDGDSYFVAEIKSMKRLMHYTETSPFCWFFIDEILKGTNTVERVAASAAVLHRLSIAPCRSFAATHDNELVSILGDACENFHFRETVSEQGVSFDYRLHSGPATTRNAILLLERMEFPTEVTHEARALVARFEHSGEWSTQ